MNEEGFLAKVIRGELSEAPITRLLGWKFIAFDQSTHTISVEMIARPEFINPAGFVHGGMLAAMLDETIAPAVAATLGPGEFAPTLELKTSFIASAAPGRMRGVGKVLNRGRTICFGEGQLLDDTGRLIAAATGTFKISSGRNLARVEWAES